MRKPAGLGLMFARMFGYRDSKDYQEVKDDLSEVEKFNEQIIKMNDSLGKRVEMLEKETRKKDIKIKFLEHKLKIFIDRENKIIDSAYSSIISANEENATLKRKLSNLVHKIKGDKDGKH